MAEFEKEVAEDDIADKKDKEMMTARSPAPESSSPPRLDLDLDKASDADCEPELPDKYTSLYQNEAPSVLPEHLRRDQRSLIYKAVPPKVTEIDMFFYDSVGKIIHSIIGLKRDANGLRYRALPKSKSHLWPLVSRIRVYSANPDMFDKDEDNALPGELQGSLEEGKESDSPVDLEGSYAALHLKSLIRDIFIYDPTPEGNPNAADPNIHAQHQLTHFPKDPKCPICNQCRIHKADCRRRTRDPNDPEAKHVWIEPNVFCDLLTADHKIVAEKSSFHESIDRDKVALVSLDFATRLLDAFPAHCRSTDEVVESLLQFCGPDQIIKAFYSDNASEITSAVRRLQGFPVTCTPHVPQTDGAAENSVRKVTEGTSCPLVQSGFGHYFWNRAMRCFWFSMNISAIMHYGTKPYYARFGHSFPGHRVPFGASIGYMRINRDTKADRIHPFSSTTSRGLLMGYHLNPGGSWSGDYLVLDEDLVRHADNINSLQPVRVKDIIVPSYFTFPMKYGSIPHPASSSDGTPPDDESGLQGPADTDEEIGPPYVIEPVAVAPLPPPAPKSAVHRQTAREKHALWCCGRLKVYRSGARVNFEAECRFHGDRCTLSQEVEHGDAVKGRPLGFLAEWLEVAEMHISKACHKSRERLKSIAMESGYDFRCNMKAKLETLTNSDQLLEYEKLVLPGENRESAIVRYHFKQRGRNSDHCLLL